MPVVVDNDANAGAWGEWKYGAGRGYNSLIYVTVSTGVGGGLVLDGRPYRGTNGMAGEIGHTTIRADGPVCTCERRGCVESLASGSYMAQAARQKLEADGTEGATLLELAGGSADGVTAEAVSRAAELGDALAQEVLRDGATALGLGVANAIKLLNPDCVILGGGVTKAGEAYWQAVREAAKMNVLPGMVVNILPAALGDDAPLWGAMYLAQEAMADVGV